MRTLLLLLITFQVFTSAAQRPARNGKDYAVFFYVTKFQQGWPALPETEKDATALKAELESSYGFQCKLVPNPGKQQIREELAVWNSRLGPNDQVLYFFSMHGLYLPSSDLGYLVAADGKYDDRYAETYLNYNELRPYFAECKAKHILVALDACHSGSFGLTRERARPEAPEYQNTAQDCATQFNNPMRYAGRQYVCSGNKNARTPAQSAFAARFLEALRKGPNAEGLLFFDDLSYWLGKAQNPQPENGTFAGHNPGGDFTFLRSDACLPPPDRDGDNVPDRADQCPDTWGSQANGCPLDLKTDNTAADLAAWKTAKQQNTAEAYREYLRRFPQGEFKEPANNALRQQEAEAARQRDQTAWDLALEKNTIEGYKKYKADLPGGAHLDEAEAKIKSLEMPDNMVFVPGGTFQMGSEDGESDEKPVHSVTVSGFYLGKYEVTVEEFKAFIDATGYRTDAEKGGKSLVYTDSWKEQDGVYWKHDTRGNLRPSTEYKHPVVHVSWNDAVEYCKWLSQKTGKNYRLPTEAEWEYAAGGGAANRTKWAGVSDESRLSKYANTNDNGDGFATTATVGSLLPNALGLFDMSGNVWEWCSDWYGSDYYKSSPTSNPQGPSSGSFRVVRGGSWVSYPLYCRVAYRFSDAPGNRNYDTGFRLARTN